MRPAFHHGRTSKLKSAGSERVTRTMRIAKRLVFGVLLLGIALRLGGIVVFSSPFYIPEAKQPKGFPSPGRVNEIIVKTYPTYRSASVKTPGAGQNGLFGSLFNHIKKNNIAMTAPVEMTYGSEDTESMAFLYADPEVGKAGYDGVVLVADHKPTQVVSVGIRGSYNRQRFVEYCKKLREWVEREDDWEICGEPRYLGYNSPFVPSFLRYGEVQFPIRPRTAVSS